MAKAELIKRQTNEFRGLLTRMHDQFAAALPKHLTPERFIRVAMTALQRNPAILECNQLSVIRAIVEASQLGLECDGVLGHAYLVPYNTKAGKVCQLIPGYKGLVDLARRSGQVSMIYAALVHEKDHFEYELGLEIKLRHVPSKEQDSGEVSHVYAVCVFKDGTRQFEVMTKRDVEKIRARSKSAMNGPWVTDWGAMAKKTVLKQLCKLLPMSVEYQRAAAIDENDDVFTRPVPLAEGIDFSSLGLPDPDYENIDGEDEGETATIPTTLDELADKVEAEASANTEIVPEKKPTKARKASEKSEFDEMRLDIEMAEAPELDMIRQRLKNLKADGRLTPDQVEELEHKLRVKSEKLGA